MLYQLQCSHPWVLHIFFRVFLPRVEKEKCLLKKVFHMSFKARLAKWSGQLPRDSTTSRAWYGCMCVYIYIHIVTYIYFNPSLNLETDYITQRWWSTAHVFFPESPRLQKKHHGVQAKGSLESEKRTSPRPGAPPAWNIWWQNTARHHLLRPCDDRRAWCFHSCATCTSPTNIHKQRTTKSGFTSTMRNARLGKYGKWWDV